MLGKQKKLGYWKGLEVSLFDEDIVANPVSVAMTKSCNNNITG